MRNLRMMDFTFIRSLLTSVYVPGLGILYCGRGSDDALAPGWLGGKTPTPGGGGPGAPCEVEGAYCDGGTWRGTWDTLVLLAGSSWDLTWSVCRGPVCQASSESSVTDVSTLTWNDDVVMYEVAWISKQVCATNLSKLFCNQRLISKILNLEYHS